MPKYRVNFETTLNVTVEVEAKDLDTAMDAAWEPAEEHVQSYSFNRSEDAGATVLAFATFDGIGATGAEEIE